jgi:hypothetical protein
MTIKTAMQATAKAGVHGIGGGLYLKKASDEPNSGSWVFRYHIGGKRREMGLGAFKGPAAGDLTLAEARDRVGELRPLVKKGIDPIEARKRESEANPAEARRQAPVNFRQATEAYFKDHAPSWRHRCSAPLWIKPIVKYAYPVIGDMALDDIGVEHVVATGATSCSAIRPTES